jgi:DnaJ-domain-containing protein 1
LTCNPGQGLPGGCSTIPTDCHADGAAHNFRRTTFHARRLTKDSNARHRFAYHDAVAITLPRVPCRFHSSVPNTLSPDTTPMPRVHTHYDNLKVARNAPPDVIRAAYRTLSKKYHPDHNPDNREAMRIIKLINAAYDVLSDPAKREAHDRWIAQEEAEELARHGSRHASNGSAPNSYAWTHRATAATGAKTQHSRRLAVPVQRFILRMQTMLDHFSRYLSKKA